MNDEDELSREPINKKYRVMLHSAAGMWQHYDGYVDVWAADASAAKDGALDRLKRESFPDRPRSGWIIDSVEQIAG